MKYLDTDKQTQADLSIADGVYDEQTLYSLYARTETKQGQKLMAEWLLYPLSDPVMIRKRQEAIAWEELPHLPLKEEELDFIEYYLDSRDEIRKVTFLSSFTTWIDRLFKHDSFRYVVRTGVGLIICMLHRLNRWKEIFEAESPLLLKDFLRTIETTIEGTELEHVLSQMPEENGNLSSYAIDKYDYLFRCVRLSELRELLSVIYQLDVCRTAHAVAVKNNFFCCPDMLRSMELSLTGLVHPFVRNARGNDWAISQENICILTGSNMAGKSTILKAMATAVWLAHCGLPVSARSMTCPVYEGIYTSINLPDSIRDGRSHFMAEILRIKEVLQNATTGKRCLVILDEMFRGTNAQDAFEASCAVNELLKKFPSCHFLISTHILEYAKHFEKDPSCSFYYMESKIEDDEFVCSYRLVQGVSESKVGYWIVKRELNI